MTASVVPDFSRAAVVVAHPDDEVLWFSSLLPKVARIVMCYGTISAGSERALNRKKAVEHHPLDNIEFLNLPIPGIAEARIDGLHRRVLADRLAVALQGVTTVLTHNPWGEYGQPDHQRVHAAVNELRSGMRFAVYVSCYVARHQRTNFAHAVDRGISDVISLPIHHSDVDRIVALYRSHSCWTWTPNWKWPEREHFLRLGVCKGAGIPAEIPLLLFGSRTKRRAEMRQPWHKILKVGTRELLVANPRPQPNPASGQAAGCGNR